MGRTATGLPWAIQAYSEIWCDDIEAKRKEGRKKERKRKREKKRGHVGLVSIVNAPLPLTVTFRMCFCCCICNCCRFFDPAPH